MMMMMTMLQNLLDCAVCEPQPRERRGHQQWMTDALVRQQVRVDSECTTK